MGNQIRSKTPGATFFFTARLADQRSTLLTDQVDLLRIAMRETVSRYPFSIDDIVVLPATIHAIWSLPEDDADFSTRWSFLKARFSRALPPPERRTTKEVLRREKGIWQRRFWEHRIRSAHDLMLHRRLIHTAPVEAGLVARPADWSWTSLHRDLATAHLRAHPDGVPKFSAMGLKTLSAEKA